MAFQDCKGLTSVAIPEGVESIKNATFSYCDNLTSVTIPSSVKTIEKNAFQNCRRLESITIPAGVTSIEDNAFIGSWPVVIVENPVPFSITSNAFPGRMYMSLCVPAGSKAAYEAADYWNEFLDIYDLGGDPQTEIEVTDISQLDNVIYIEPVASRSGKILTLSVKMKNSVPMESFGFDLVLPEGVFVATDEDGFALAELSTERTTARKTNHFDALFKPDGSLNVQAYSSIGYTISGNDGEIALITIKIASTLVEGTYPIILKEISMGDASATSYRVESVTSALTIPSYILGDANADGYVDVADLTAISHKILERPDASFNQIAADANGDGFIDVGDLTAVSHIILWGSVLPPNAASRSKRVEQIIEPE